MAIALADPRPFYIPGGRVGCLLIHGFGGSPAEMRGLGLYLAEQGITAYAPLLAGHGTTPEDWAKTGWTDWIASAEDGLRRLLVECEVIFLAGLSFGGVIGLHLASHYPIRGLAVMSTPVYIADWRVRFVSILKYMVRYVTPNQDNDLVDPQAKRALWIYDRVPTVAVESCLKFIAKVRGELGRVSAPLLIIQSSRDKTVSPKCASYLYERVASTDKRLLWLDNSGHGVTVDMEKEKVWAEVGRFIRERNPQWLAPTP